MRKTSAIVASGVAILGLRPRGVQRHRDRDGDGRRDLGHEAAPPGPAALSGDARGTSGTGGGKSRSLPAACGGQLGHLGHLGHLEHVRDLRQRGLHDRRRRRGVHRLRQEPRAARSSRRARRTRRASPSPTARRAATDGRLLPELLQRERRGPGERERARLCAGQCPCCLTLATPTDVARGAALAALALRLELNRRRRRRTGGRRRER